MTQINARIIETDVFSAIGNTSAGSATVDMFGSAGGASRFSCQAIYTVTANPSAAAIVTADIKTSADVTRPSSFMKTAHGFVTGLKVQATTDVTGTLAVPLAVSTDYFVIKSDADYFQLASSLANALAGTAIAITNVGVTSTTLTPVELAGASVTFQKSNDGLIWVDLQTATPITATGTVIVEVANVSYRYLKVVKALTAGIVAMSARVLVIGDAS